MGNHPAPAAAAAGGQLGDSRARKGLWRPQGRGVDESVESLLQHTVAGVEGAAGQHPLRRSLFCAVGGACPDAVRETLADGLRASVAERLRAAAQEAAARQLAIEVLAAEAQHAAAAGPGGWTR